MKLQKREKVLLVILLIVAITVLPIFFIIQPLMLENTAKKSELTMMEQEYADLEMGAQIAAIYQEGLAEIEEHMQTEGVAIPSKMKSYDIHYLVEDACNKAGVTLEGIKIGEYEKIEAQSAAGAGEEPSAILQVASLDASMTGGFHQIMNVVDDLSSNLYVVVTGLNINTVSTIEGEQASMKLDIYAVLQPGEEGFAEAMPQQTETVDESDTDGE